MEKVTEDEDHFLLDVSAGRGTGPPGGGWSGRFIHSPQHVRVLEGKKRRGRFKHT